jgi:hypothetical protein
MSIDIASKGAKRSQYFIDSVKLIEQVLETVNEFTKDRREHIESIDDEIKLVKEKITNAKQGWIIYLESLEKTLLENVQGQKDKFASNAQKEIFETKQIEEHITKLKDTFEFVEKHGSDKQAFLLSQTLKADLSDIEETIATLTEKASNTNIFVGSKGSMHVLDHQGHPVRKIKTKKQDRIPVYITVCSSGSLCYSDYVSLYCIKPDGEEVFTYS